MAHSQADALISAAISGKVDRIAKLLSEGAPVEAQDMNRATPMMLAAQHGHVEAFRRLVEAGANLHAVAARQKDVLEAAVDSGSVELVQFLLDRGLPVDGHWKLPDSDNPAFRKIGHDTPLIRAADSGNVEIVRILLEAGADRDRKHNGQTALDVAKEHLSDPDHEDNQQAYREVVALLVGAPAENTLPVDSPSDEVARFAANANRPEYEKLYESLVATCGHGRPWKAAPDHGVSATNVVAFTLKNVKKQKRIDELQAEARDTGCHLVLGEPWVPGDDAKLVLFPTANKLAVVVAVGTEGANHGVKCIPHLVDWLMSLDSEDPFQLILCTHEAIGGTFVSPVKAATKLAARMAKLCPSVLDDVGDEPTLALGLKKRKSFLLRWD